jgi:hypothetical protein
VALGRKNYLFMGSERGGQSAAIAYTLIETAKLNGVNPPERLHRTVTLETKMTAFDNAEKFLEAYPNKE